MPSALKEASLNHTSLNLITQISNPSLNFFGKGTSKTKSRSPAARQTRIVSDAALPGFMTDRIGFKVYGLGFVFYGFSKNRGTAGTSFDTWDKKGLRESTIKEQRGIFPEAMPYNSLALRNWEFKV